MAGWLTEWLTGWLTGWLTDWLTDWLNDWINEWMAGRLAGWMTHWLADWMADWLTEWMNDWINEWMTEWMNEWQAGWLNDSLAKWLIDWVTGFVVVDKLTCIFSISHDVHGSLCPNKNYMYLSVNMCYVWNNSVHFWLLCHKKFVLHVWYSEHVNWSVKAISIFLPY